jgi:hypothetical protein
MRSTKIRATCLLSQSWLFDNDPNVLSPWFMVFLENVTVPQIIEK